jgi:glycosyltransferase involved in cell wall biosynthesis
MKILTVLDSLKPGGVRERAFQLSRALIKAGHEAQILAAGRADDLIALPPEIAPLVCLTPSIGARYPIPHRFRSIRKTVEDSDVIHIMSHWSALHVLVFLLARLCHTSYVVCPAGALRIYGRSRWLKRIYNGLVGERIVREADRVIAITRDELPLIRAYGVISTREAVLPNAVALEDFQPVERAFRLRHDLPDRPFILFLGRLNPIKGPDLLLDAFLAVEERMPAYHLVFAGSDEGLEENLRQRAQGAGEKVHFVGELSGAMKVDALTEAAFLAIPSRHEAMSIVALEAGACGTPVLATDRCGFPELEQAGGGIIVPATVEGLARGLMLMADETRTSDMGCRLVTLVRERYSWSASVAAHLRVFEDARASRSGR